MSKPDAAFTFVEMCVVTAIVSVLASIALPLARVTMQRNREIELRHSLREIRTAIDRFKDAVDAGLISQEDITPGSDGYPRSLQQLVDGVAPANDFSGRRLLYLRRVPIDSMTGTTDWGLRSVQDEPSAQSWSGNNVFDIYTKSRGRGLDGSLYRDW